MFIFVSKEIAPIVAEEMKATVHAEHGSLHLLGLNENMTLSHG